MAIRYPNLAAEIARKNICIDDVYDVTAVSTGKTKDTASNWLHGRAGELPVSAAMAIKQKFFPSLTIEYLFGDKTS